MQTEHPNRVTLNDTLGLAFQDTVAFGCGIWMITAATETTIDVIPIEFAQYHLWAQRKTGKLK